MPASEHSEVKTELKLVLEMTARVDERVKLVVEKQAEMTSRLNSFIDAHNSLSSRVSVLESKGANGLGELKNKYENLIERITRLESSSLKSDFDDLEGSMDQYDKNVHNVIKIIEDIRIRLAKVEESHSSTWAKGKFFFDLFVKGAWAIAIAWLLWRLGLSGTHLPG